MKKPLPSLRLLLNTFAVFLAATLLAAEQNRSIASRSDSLKAICQRLEIGPGAVIADVGCGDGPDSMVFASIVGERGTVLAQEIEPAKLKKVVETAEKRGFHQVMAVLGQSDDPRLPDGLVNMIYMCRVFHHFSNPRAMLRRMFQDLAPGGCLVVVDQQKGPLTDWASLESREKQHHWTGETTVVRLAREAGFLFHGVLDDLWHEKQPFVLVFRKPAEPAKVAGDPDLPLPLDAAALLGALPPAQEAGEAAVVFFGLDRGRAVLPKLQAKLPASSRLFDVVLEEWALSREELPPEPGPARAEIVRTDKGALALPTNAPPRLVLFADAYHRLWDPVPMLRRLKEQMPDSGLVAVVDRQGPEGESRRLAGHHRRIASTRVIEDMRQAGFALRQSLAKPAGDRFFLLFELAKRSP
jgi:predicted methyltransferase